MTGISAENVQFTDQELTRLRKDIDALKQEIQATSTSTAPETIPDIDAAINEIWGLTINFRRNFEAAEPAERQRILRPFLRKITVFPKENRAVVELFKVPVTEEMKEHTGRVVPPTGLTPYGKAVPPTIFYEERDFPQLPVRSKRGRRAKA